MDLCKVGVADARHHEYYAHSRNDYGIPFCNKMEHLFAVVRK
ncbi:hypothetical protein [Helicobacter rodentium]|nr:hypothetical protein [Helicobacter rodentium]